MINTASGQLTLGDGQLISSTTKLETIEAMNLGEVQQLKNLKNGWIWYDVKNLKIEENYFNISFVFENDRLRGSSFVFQEEAFNLESSNWSSWSETAEREQAQRFNNWLDELLNKKRDFDWGTVWAGYDPKGGASSVRIRYVNR